MEVEGGVEEKSRNDQYWAQFYSIKHFGGDLKFPTLTKIVQSALTISLSHGNGYLERSFSTSAQSLIGLCDCSINRKKIDYFVNRRSIVKSRYRLP